MLLPQNSLLTHHHLDLLQQHGIELWQEDAQLVSEMIIGEAIEEVRMMYDMIHNNVENISNLQIQTLFVPKIQELCSNSSMSDIIFELSKKDNFTYRHCMGVAIISYLIGKWLGMEEDKLHDLAVSGLLHDIGKIKISDAILSKSSRLTADEYAEMKLHTHYGYDMIRALPGMTEQQALVALQHHEREDGSGYPFGIYGDRMTKSSKIVAVADVFHTMVSERVYKRPVPLYQVFQELYRNSYEIFDPEVIQCFITNMMNRMIGDTVILSDGRTARIVMVHPDDLILPLVEAEGQFYDLRKSQLKIIDFTSSHSRLAKFNS